MTITLNGTTGITTPAGTIQGDLTTTGNTVLGDASTDTLNVANGGLVKDSSGNLGLGVTPSAWKSTSKALQVNTTGAFISDTSYGTYISDNLYLNSGAQWIRLTTNYATLYGQGSGTHVWYTAPSGTAGTAITFTQAMALDNSGYLLVGTTSPNNANSIGLTLDPAGGIGYTTSNSGTQYPAAFRRNPDRVVGTNSTSGTSTS